MDNLEATAIASAVNVMFSQLAIPAERFQARSCAKIGEVLHQCAELTQELLLSQQTVASELYADLKHQMHPTRYEDRSTPQQVKELANLQNELSELNTAITFIEAIRIHAATLKRNSKAQEVNSIISRVS
jgi:hypothetical protein